MISFKAVTKRFSPESHALQDVSFEINPGEFVFITGPSGSGKTTIMRLLTREYSPTSGEIFLNQSPVHHIKDGQIPHLRRQIGIIFQDYKLLPENNVWENIALPLYIIGKPLAEIESRVTDLLKLVDLVDKAYLFPNQLSGGEAQRVSIARALASGPSMIFADEPTGNLDPETSLTIARLLYKINQLGTTVLLATHDMGVLAELPDARHIHLEKGALVRDTRPVNAPTPTSSPASPAHSTPPSASTSQQSITSSQPATPNSPPPTPTLKKHWWWPFGRKSDAASPTKTTTTKQPTTHTESISVVVETLETTSEKSPTTTAKLGTKKSPTTVDQQNQESNQ